MAIFDPLGFLTPFTIRSRILMQKFWTLGIGWDEKIRDEDLKEWKLWLLNLKKVKTCRVDRCYQLKQFQTNTAELHVFCDASSKAHAAVGYWRFKLPDDTFHVSFILAKSRVAPLKPTTFPRLELQAALLATRLTKTTLKEHDFQVVRRVLWSDSKTILYWINKNPRDFKVFVANQLWEISENSEVSE